MRAILPSAVLNILTCLSLFSNVIFAAPNLKAPWTSAARSRLLKHGKLNSKRQWQNETTCTTPGPANLTAPKSNIWVGLTDYEAASVTAWLFGQADLNLTAADQAGEWDNSVILVELLQPNKSDALAYIDGNATAPTRYAHVVLDNRATLDPHFQDIVVGPLPVQSGVTTWYLSTGHVPPSPTEYIFNITSTIVDITMNLWGGSATGNDNDTLDVWSVDPRWQDDGRLVSWQTFWHKPTDEFDAETLLPLGLFFKLDLTGRDPSQWTFEGWLYNNIFYPTTDAFRTAFYSPGFVQLGANVEGDWARTDQQGDVPPADYAPPPVMTAPGGARYSVDQGAKYVEWMDWSFYISFSRDRGLALFDIRYKNERIIYELGLEEALAHYAGNDPFQSGTSYLDSYYGFGPYAFQLVPGYNCPSHASYLNTSFFTEETTHTHINSVCLFEYNADFPMQRHSTSRYVSATKNVYFTVRSVSTVGNYDYMFSYEFSLDGSIKVEVRASGYIQSAYYANNADYGYQIHDFLSGSMHDHVLNFKADVDILGTANTMELTTNIPVSETYSWSPTPRNTMKLARRQLQTEDEGGLFWDANAATQYRVVNKAAPNAYGEYRGYRLLPSSGTAHLTVLNSSNLANASNWAQYDLAVTRHHDTEPRSAHPYNSQDVHRPPVDFDAFFDSESLQQEDLVLWFNLGMHHVPHTGDLPNTVFTTAHSGVQFAPANYFPGDVSRQTVQQVRVDYDGGAVRAVETFGQSGTGALAEEETLWGYTGDVVVRKFPYDPNDPYFETDSIV